MEVHVLTELEKCISNLSVKETSSVSLEAVEPDYVLDFACQDCESVEDSLLAASSSNFTVRLYNRNTLAHSKSITGHSDVITGVKFGNREKDLLFSSSHDKTIRCWDLRTDMKKEVQLFKGDEDMIFTCVDVNQSDRLVSAGTELSEEDTFIVFWDRRKSDTLGCYSESHQDDITKVCFHPSIENCLASSSTDGLVCIYNLSETDEDEALLTTLNAESSIAQIGWCGYGNDDIFCITDIGSLHLWHKEGDSLCEFRDLKEKFQSSGVNDLDYLVDCLFLPESDSGIIVAGSYSGDLHMLSLDDGDVSYVCGLSGSHKDIVRCTHWDRKTKTLLTGGEDSMLCLWSTENNKSKEKTDLKSKKKPKGKVKPYGK